MSKFIYSVTQLTRELRSQLETGYRGIWVEGEISGLATPASGHWYFSLKESNAVIRCAFFRNRRSSTSITPKNGMQVLVRGQISLYEPRGDLQYIVSYMEESGEGALRRAFERLKQKLAEEGLFESNHKKPIPPFPQSIGIVTSQTGAALRDMLTTLARRHPSARVILYPTLVQGEMAPGQIADMLDLCNQRNEVDVLILGRGGGSLEDLQAFNEEVVARAIFSSSIPVVCGIGHETDFTIADMVGDLRAATPTAAAEQVSPDIEHIKRRVINAKNQLMRALTRTIQGRQQGLDYLSARLLHPSQKLINIENRRRSLEQQLILRMTHRMSQAKYELQAVVGELRLHAPRHQIETRRNRLERAQRQLTETIKTRLKALQSSVNVYQEKMNIMSPEHTLNRGYAIVQNANKQVVIEASQVISGESLTIKVAKGNIDATVSESRS